MTDSNSSDYDAYECVNDTNKVKPNLSQSELKKKSKNRESTQLGFFIHLLLECGCCLEVKRPKRKSEKTIPFYILSSIVNYKYGIDYSFRYLNENNQVNFQKQNKQFYVRLNRNILIREIVVFLNKMGYSFDERKIRNGNCTEGMKKIKKAWSCSNEQYSMKDIHEIGENVCNVITYIFDLEDNNGLGSIKLNKNIYEQYKNQYKNQYPNKHNDNSFSYIESAFQPSNIQYTILSNLENLVNDTNNQCLTFQI